MNVFLILSFVLMLPPVGSSAAEQSQASLSTDVEGALGVLPAPQEKPKGEYRLDPEHIRALKARMDVAKAKGDIIKPILDKLGSLRPGTARDEARLLQLVKILEQYPDERALPVLEKLEKLTPKIRYSDIDGGRRFAYDFKGASWQAGNNIRAELGASRWAKKLEALDKQARIDRLADAIWFDKSTDKVELLGAHRLLYRECDDPCRLEVVLQRIYKVPGETEDEQRLISRGLSDIRSIYQRGLHDPRIKATLGDMLVKFPKGRIGEAARIYLRNIEASDARKK